MLIVFRWKTIQKNVELKRNGFQVVEIYTCKVEKLKANSKLLEHLYEVRLKERQSPLDITEALKGGM